MTSKRLFIILLSVTGLVMISMVAGAYGINTLLTSQSNKLVSLKAKSQALSQEQLSLAKAKKDIQTYSGLETIAETVVPQDKDQAEAVRELVDIASANGIKLGSITFPASTLGNTAGTTATGVAIVPTTASASANSKTSALSQLQPVKNIPGVYQLAITVQSDTSSPVPYTQFINFLSALEHNRRTSQVTGITLTPNPLNASQLSFSLVLEDYIKP